MNNDERRRAGALERWLPERLGVPRVQVSELARSGEGSSNETVVFTASWPERGQPRTRKLVLRVQPSEHQLFLAPDAVREARVVQAVAAASVVPVPSVIGAEPDASLIGAPFFVMEHLDGRTLRDVPSMHAVGWLTDLAAEARTRHYVHGLEALAGIARMPADDLGFLARAGGGTPLEQLVDATEAYFDWASAGRDLGVVTVAMQEVRRRVPDHGDAALSWGDARPGNLLFAEDGSVAAVLDWEMAELGPAEVDLGWWLVTEEFYSAGLGVQMLPGVPDHAQTVALWQELVGRAPRELDYYKLLAGLRFSLVLVRARDLNVARATLGPESTMHTHNPMTQVLARLLERPVLELAPEFADIVDRYAATRDAATAAPVQD
ncbi:MAG: hypothetical protein QOJ03_1137 [Frankiaceae bacterium]|nr:hypothetical protein [Frankiaceae bacterium]